MTQIAALIRKDLRELRNIGHVLRRQSRFKVIFIALFALGLLGGLFALFLEGFAFLDTLGGAGFMVTRYLFALFFLGLGAMLVVSSTVSTYTTGFRSRETPFLLTNPFSVRDIVTYKVLESCLLSSWAFLFIIIPFAGAYALHQHLGISFVVWTFAFSIPFLVLCSSIGSVISLVFVRWMPRGRLPAALSLMVLVAAAGALRFGMQREAGEDGASFVLTRVVPGLHAASLPLMPSWWTAEGLRACAGGQLGRGFMLWCVLVSNALLVVRLTQGLGERTFYTAFQRVTGGKTRSRHGSVVLTWLERALGLLGRDIRAIVMKDVRTFLRDPMQWSQALIFFGLLAFYFGSIRSFHYSRLPQAWRNLIAFLNVFSVAAVECSLASRFIYPQLSLEGQAFWMLGLSPVKNSRVLATKFLTSLVAMVAVSTALMYLSTRMLRVDPLIRVVAMGLAVAISAAVSALSTGLGAIFLDLKQSNPAAIVSGFGGTINLVLSLAFMLCAIIPFGLVFHLSYAGRIGSTQTELALLACGGWLVLLTLTVTAVPLWLGQRSLNMRDY